MKYGQQSDFSPPFEAVCGAPICEGLFVAANFSKGGPAAA
jgi:hypothetical protein